MANDEHVAMLKKGVEAWNAWRKGNRHINPDLRGAEFREEDLRQAHLIGANLIGAHLEGAKLDGARLDEAKLINAHLSGANLSGAHLNMANLSLADLSGDRTKLVGAHLMWVHLVMANLNGADLRGAKLGGANLEGTKLHGANLRGADLQRSQLIGTDFTGADLTGCRVFGVSAWSLELKNAKQLNLIVTHENEPDITVDNIEIAQFIYLMLNNQKIRDMINTITSKAVLILGRFTGGRIAVLNALREELRKHNYLPILFDFDPPERRNITETVTLLARMARFVIADLTDPSSIPQELQAIIPSVRVPVQPLLLEGSALYSMFKDFDQQDFPWVLPVYRYKEPQQLLATLAENVIAPAERKVIAMEERRRKIEGKPSSLD